MAGRYRPLPEGIYDARMSDFFSSFGQAELLAIASSLCFTVTLIVLRQGMRTGSPLAAVLTINAVVSGGSLVIALFRGTLLSSSLVPLLWFAAMGAVGAGVGSICRMVAVERMGLGPSTLVASTTPLWGVILAIAVLGEQPTARVWAGTLLIVGGVSLITLARDRGGTRFREWFRAALIFPVVASLVYAIAPVFTKFAYSHQKTPMAGLGVAFAVGSLLLLAARPLLPGGGVIRATRKSMVLFIIGGVFNLIAAFFFMTALTFGQLSSVLPVSRLTPLWVVLFSPLFLGKLERLTPLLLIAALLVVAGGILITTAGS